MNESIIDIEEEHVTMPIREQFNSTNNADQNKRAGNNYINKVPVPNTNGRRRDRNNINASELSGASFGVASDDKDQSDKMLKSELRDSYVHGNNNHESSGEPIEEDSPIKQKSLKELGKQEMPLKHKIMLGPLAKYKQYSKYPSIWR